MPEKNEASPRPWHVEDCGGNEYDEQCAVIDAKGLTVAIVENAEIASRIVEAVNLRDNLAALVAENERLRITYNACVQTISDGQRHTKELLAQQDALRTALIALASRVRRCGRCNGNGLVHDDSPGDICIACGGSGLATIRLARATNGNAVVSLVEHALALCEPTTAAPPQPAALDTAPADEVHP